MGEKLVFQPLTRAEKISVVLYRSGIVMSTAIIAGLSYLLMTVSENSDTAGISSSGDVLAYALYASVGMSVFFIHLYISRIKRYLKNLFFISLGCLAALLYLGQGSVSNALVHTLYSPLLLLPVVGCLSFVTAKEAFCFKLFEGYLLAMIMPLYLLLVATRGLAGQGVSYGLALIAVMLAIFTLRKVFMPIAYDIGDKSAYQ
jgi:uncharacterized integral membrane protein